MGIVKEHRVAELPSSKQRFVLVVRGDFAVTKHKAVSISIIEGGRE